MLKQRFLTTLVILPLALVIIFALPIFWFALAVLVVLALAAWEWSSLMSMKSLVGRIVYVGVVVAAIAALWTYVPLEQVWHEGALHPFILAVVASGVFWWLLAIVLVFNFPRSQSLWARNKMFVAMFGLLIFIPTWAAALGLRSLFFAELPMFGAWMLLFVLVLVWAADVGAYFAGRRFGKHKLMPRVSPAKTLEGVFGGLLLALLVMAGVAFFLPVQPEQLPGYFLVGVVTVLASVFGDLNESMFKRFAGVKDSGSMLPGHGGMLDRIDSLTSALPVFLIGYVFFVVS